AVAQRPDLPEPVLDGHSARFPASPLMDSRDHHVAGLLQLVGLEAPFLERSNPASEKASHRLRATSLSRAGQIEGLGVPLDIDVQELEEGFRPSLGLLVHPTDDLDVLLRHRSRSISPKALFPR